MTFSYFKNRRMEFFAVSLFVCVVQFQNCSNTKFSSAEKQILESTSVDQSQHTVSVYSVAQENAIKLQPLKVLLIIDNSGSMRNTQEKLKSNIRSLVSKLKNFNTEIRIIRTDELISGRYSATVATIDSAGRPIQVTQAKSQIEANVPHFKFAISQTAAEKESVITSLENAIANVGVAGSGQEAPIASFAYSMLVDQYFLTGDASLIYFITDEDDSFSMEQFSKYPLRQQDLTMALKPAIELKYLNPYSYKYLLNGVTYISYNLSATRCQTAQPTTGYLADCSLSLSPYTFILEDETCENFITTRQLTNAEQSLIACKSSPQFDSFSITNQRSYIFDLQPGSDGKIIQAEFFPKLRAMMEQKFGTRYLFAVSANLSNQPCAITSEQSYDVMFGTMKNYFPTEKVILSSICSDTDYSSLIEKMVTTVTKVMTQVYQLNIKPEDVISQVTLVSQTGERLILRVDQYLRTGNQIEFVNVNLARFESGTIEIKKLY